MAMAIMGRFKGERRGARALENPGRDLAACGVKAKSPDDLVRTLPFAPGDVTCGAENELQAAVMGPADRVDLPLAIAESQYFHNLVKRHRRGEVPRLALTDLERWLSENRVGVWESSWVRVPLRGLSRPARRLWRGDLRKDKSQPGRGMRPDAGRYSVDLKQGPGLRVPVSYLLRLALRDCLDREPVCPPELLPRALKYLDHFTSDNTSPEISSFHLVDDSHPEGMGHALAGETARRFILCQLLMRYTEAFWGLAEDGQRPKVYNSPHPPVRLRRLSYHISDSFYRDLFMNPCLAGWERGFEKHRYMHLCHQVLSRAQFNALGRLKEAGILHHDLVALPPSSNISLANNGCHISLGSGRLSRAAAAGELERGGEKRLADLAIKAVEHFLPLFVGVYSAAPYRLGFRDFCPERVLRFLPYQLDYTHLRMIWRRWKKKAAIKIKPLGVRVTPFGVGGLDKALSWAFGLRGDMVPDFRLLDYLAALMSSDANPALDGREGNQERLKEDLALQGVFDPDMPMYLLYRQRAWGQHGYAGFEGRHHSLFPSLAGDMAPAADLQRLLTAHAFALIAKGELSHAHIPDDPMTESERRQIFFGAAAGIPTFFVRQDTPNRFLAGLVAATGDVRPSRRYAGFLRVRQDRFKPALARRLASDCPELIEALGLSPLMADLTARLVPGSGLGAAARLERGVRRLVGGREPLGVRADDYNQAVEAYYREDLLAAQTEEAAELMERDLARLTSGGAGENPDLARAAQKIAGGRDPVALWREASRGLAKGKLSRPMIIGAINLVLLASAAAGRRGARAESEQSHANDASIY